MHILGWLLSLAAIFTVSARHKRDWEFVNMKKISRERLQPFYRSEDPDCSRGVGFYRDPHDCHQYIRCVDDFSTGRQMSIFIGRCRPGLVFDETISNCNWPELAEPCNNSPERFNETPTKFKPKDGSYQKEQDNNISGYEDSRNKPYVPQQQVQEQVHQEEPQASIFQESEKQKQTQQSFQDIQVPNNSKQPQIQEQVFQKETGPVSITQQTQSPINQQRNKIVPQFQQTRRPIPQSHENRPVKNPSWQEISQQQKVFQERPHPFQQQVKPISQIKNIQEKVNLEESKPLAQAQQVQTQVVQEQSVKLPPNSHVWEEVPQQQKIQKPFPEEYPPASQEQTFQEQDEQEKYEPISQNQESEQIPEKSPIWQEVSQQEKVRPGHIESQRPAEQKTKPVHQTQNRETGTANRDQQVSQTQQIFQEKYDEFPQRENNWQNDQQQKIYQEPANSQQPSMIENNKQQEIQQNSENNKQNNQFQEDVPSGNFQEVPDSQEVPSSNKKGIQQQQVTSQWLVASNDKSERPTSLGLDNRRRPGYVVPTTLDEPILCKREGFFKHPKDCTRFVRCVVTPQRTFSVHFFQCAQSLVFDETEKHCVSPNGNKCALRRSKRQSDNVALECKVEGFFRHPGDCHSFYRCVKQASGSYETFLFSCPDTLVFDEEYTICNWPDKAPPCETPNNFMEFTRKTTPTNRPSFKPIKQTANPVYKSTTKPRNDFIDKTNPFTSKKDRYTQKSQYTTQATVVRQQECNRPGFFQHDYDCTKFYKCVRRGNYFVRYELSCPNNFAYDEFTSRCVSLKYSNGCNRNNKPFPPRQYDDGGSSSTETTSTTSTKTPSPESNNEIGCVKEGFFRNPNDCNLFYRCVDFSGAGEEFVKYDFKCAEGLIFDVKNSVCNWPDQSDPCEGGSERDTGGEESSDNDGTSSENPIDDRSSSPTTTRTTTRSGEGKTTASSSSSPGESTAPPEKTTSNSSKRTNPPNESSDDGCNREGFFRNPEDCNKFYRCVDFRGNSQDFVRYDFSCPDGLVFDEANKVCNWPSESSPCESKANEEGRGQPGSSASTSSPGVQDTDKSTDRSTDKQRTTTQASTTRSSTQSDSTSPTKKEGTGRTTSKTSQSSTTPETDDSTDSNRKPNNNQCQETGFFRNPEDCNKFYRCVDYNGNGQEFVKYDFACPEGLVFDEKNSVCNWPDQSSPCESFVGEDDADQGKDSSSSTVQSGQDSQTDGVSTTSSSTTTKRPLERGSTASSRTTKTTQRTRSPTRTESTDATSRDTEQSSTKPSTDVSSTRSDGRQKYSQCQEAGFFRNPEDCNKFYRCVDYNGDGVEFVKYDFACPEGLVFDEENSVCNWPDQTKPCEGSGPDSEGNGSKGEGGPESEGSGPDSDGRGSGSDGSGPGSEGSVSGSEDSSTVSGDSVSSTQRSTQSTSSVVTDESIVTESSSTLTSSTQTTVEATGSTKIQETTISDNSGRDGSTRGTSKSDQNERTGECTEAGFFRNPDDCGKFYRCVDFNGDGREFVRYDFDCPDGLYFDEVNSVCNWPEQTPSCENRPGTVDLESTTIASQTSMTSTTQSSRTTDQTSSSSATENASQETTQTFSTQTTEQVVSSTSSIPNTTKESSNSSCTESGFFRCPEDCTKFFRCVDDNGNGENYVRYNFSCPDGLIFDEKNKKCDWPSSELTCDEGTSTSVEDTRSTTPSISSTTVSTPEGELSTTSSESTAGDTTTSTSTSVPSRSTNCTEEGFFRDPNDCSKYYRCIDEGDGTFTREDFSCEEDEIFDEEMRFCNRQELAPPCNESTSQQTTSGTQGTTQSESSSTSNESTSQQTTSGTQGTTQSESSITSNESTSQQTTSGTQETTQSESSITSNESTSQQTTSGTQETTQSESSTTSTRDITTSTTSLSTTQKSTQSNCTEEGFFRCPEDCTKFYRCVNFEGDNENLVRYNFTCPEGLIFDETNRKCGWPSSELTCDNDEPTTSTTSSSTTSSTDTSPSSGTASSSDCTEEGFFRNPDDCNKYYRCLDEGDGTLTREDFSCGKDEIFDEEMRYCNHKDLAPPCNESTQTTTEFDGSSESSLSSDSTTSSSITTASISTTISETTTANITTTFETTTVSSTTNVSTTQSGAPTTEANLSTESTTQVGGESPQSGDCQEEGFHRDPDDCNKFYRCVDFTGDGNAFTKYDFVCPEGLVFDESNNVCNWPSAVPNCESEGRNQSSTTSDDSGSTSTKKEDSSTTEVASTKSTTTSRSTATGSSITTTEGENTGTNPTSGSTTTSSSVSTSSQTSSSRPGSIECTEEGFFRHPDDCTKFYRCVDFAGTGESYVRYDFECPDDLVFDEVNSVCNWPNQSPACDNRSKNDKESGITTTSVSESSSVTTTTLSSSSNAASSSTSPTVASESTTSSTSDATSSTDASDFQCEEEGFFSHPTNCKKFYECKIDEDTGELVKIDCECPDGHVFDVDGWYCNAEELAPPCNDGSFRCQEEGLYRDPEDCTGYYQCNRTGPGENDFRRQRFECQDGNVFDEAGQYCNAPELSEPCENASVTTSSSSTTSDSSISTINGTNTVDGGTSTPPNPNGSTSTSQSETSDQCIREGFFRNSENCNKYYQCIRNADSGEFERKDFSCPDGRIFDESVNYCNDPRLSEEPCDTTSSSNGQTGSTVSPPSTSSTKRGTDITSTSSASTTQSSRGSTDSSSTSSTNNSGDGRRGGGGNLECTEAGFFRHPGDCNKFYRCVDFAGTGESFVRFDFDCPEGLHFDEVNSVCNWPTMTPSCTSENDF